MFDKVAPSLDALKSAPVKFHYKAVKYEDAKGVTVMRGKHTVLIDAMTAQAILKIHEAANEDNKAKMERMISASPVTLRRLVDFCWKHVKIGG